MKMVNKRNAKGVLGRMIAEIDPVKLAKTRNRMIVAAKIADAMKAKNLNQKQYDEAKARVEELIAEATAKGMLEPEMDNAYTQEIASLSKLMAQFEDESLNILPLRQKSLGINA